MIKRLLDKLGTAAAVAIVLVVLLAALAFAGWLVYILITAIIAITLKTFLITAGAICFCLVVGFGLYVYWQLHQG